jgi:hypothetical protein
VCDRRSARHGDRNRLAWGNSASIAISVALAFVFGYALTLGPILRAGVPLRRAAGLTVAADTTSIATMELIDNAFLLVVPGAMAADLSDRALLVEPCSQPRRRVRDHRSREQVAHRSRSRACGRPAPPLTTYVLRLQAMSRIRFGARTNPRCTADFWV